MFTDQPIVIEDDCTPPLKSHLLDETRTLLASSIYTEDESDVDSLMGLPYERLFEENYECYNTLSANSFLTGGCHETVMSEYPRACLFSHGLPYMD